MNTPLSHILNQKGHAVTSVPPVSLVIDAVQVMNHFHIGAVVVTDSHKKLLGIFTERDVLNRIVAQGLDPRSTQVRTVMSTKLVTVGLANTVEEAMTLFMGRRVRHLPVVEHEVVVGIVSIGDINRRLLGEREHEVRHLRDYIHGGVPTPV